MSQDLPSQRMPLGTSTAQDLLDRFEAAWRSGPPPPIEAFLPVQQPQRQTVLRDLVKVDLEYRWRRNVPGAPGSLKERPLLEDYLARYPELGPLNQLPEALIEEEYWVRQRWGDRPSHANYAARFPQHGAKLCAALARIDTELATEFAGER